MIANYLVRAQLTAKSIARKAAYGSLGGLFALIGIGFLAAAGWVALAQAYGAIGANLIIGGIFVFIGILVLAYSRIPPRIISKDQARAMSDPTKPSPTATATGATPTVLTTAGIAQAFILGLTAARSISRRD